MTNDMQGKICMVTGANSGIGYITARELAKKGATVVMVCRSRERGEKAQQEIINSSGSQDVHLLLADLSVQAEIHQLAATFQAQFDRLDVLVNNAGAIFTDRRESADGLELTIALNHLGYFLLTNLLLDVLKASGAARIVNVSSDAHRSANIHFDDLQLTSGYSAFRAYGQSKLANILFTRELARRLEGTAVTANAMHPGFVNTGFGKNNGGLMAAVMKVLSPLFAVSPEKGAETAVFLATAPTGSLTSGKYFAKKRETTTSVAAQSDTDAKRLWDISAELTGLKETV